MKSYDEFAEEVFREADRRLALKRKRAAVIRRYTYAFASMFAIILTGIFVIKNETVREALEKKFNSRNIITDDTNVTTSPANTTTSVPESHEHSVTTVSVTYPQGDISETTVKTAVTTTAPKPEITTSAKTSGSTTASAPVSLTSAACTTERTQDVNDTTVRVTATHPATSPEHSEIPVTTVTATRTTRTTVIPHTTATTIRTTQTTSTKKTTTSTSTTTTVMTYTTSSIFGTLTSTTFPVTTSPPLSTTSWATATTTTGSTYPVTTTTAVTSTTITQPLYPDVELPPETADPSGTVTVPVTYFCAGEMSGSDSLNKQIGVIMIESGGTEYECSVYSMGGFDTMDRVAIYIKDKWLVYWAVAPEKG